MSEAQGNIRLAAEDIDDLIAEHEVDEDLRVAGAERRDQWHHGQPAVGQCRADPQPALWHALVGNRFLDLVHVGEDASCSAQVGFTLGGEGDGAGAAACATLTNTSISPERPLKSICAS